MTGVVKVASVYKVEPFVGEQDHAISSQLHTAQQRLLHLRAQLQASRSEAERLSPFEEGHGKERPYPTTTHISQLPAHLGWESTALTRSLRQTQPLAKAEDKPVQLTETAVPPTVSPQAPHPTFPKTIKVYPDLAFGLLGEAQVAAGRLWLLLQVVDGQGRGWIAEKQARSVFTGKRGALRFCGVRQLRNLLAQGEGVFWQRENGRIWLRSMAKVAFALGIARLKMRPVAVPVRVLTQNIGTVRAHLYATFHSSRTQQKAKKPIARTTVSGLTQVQPRTQRRYERQAGVKRQAQFAIGGQATAENLQVRGWEQGQAVFQFKDFKGKQGQSGKNYVAWQLPNSYVGPHAQQPKGRQKRINRALTDLFMQGMTGNGQCSSVARRFFDNGRLAAKSYLRNPAKDHYWRGVGNGRYQLWQVMENCELK